MKPVTFAGATAYLIDTLPDWSAPVDVTAQAPSDLELGLAGHETRRPLGDTLRLRLTYRGVVTRDALLDWRDALLALTTHKVLCPLWPAGFEAGATPPVIAAYYALIDDSAAPEIKTEAQRPFSRTAYPLLVGRLESQIDPVLLDDERAQLTIQFIEDGAYPITPPAYTPPEGLPAVPPALPATKWAWLKADAQTLDDLDPVPTWEDSSGNNRDSGIPYPGNQPIFRTNQLNGKPAIYWATIAYHDWADFSALTAGEIFALVKADTDPGTGVNGSALWDLSGIADPPNSGAIYSDTDGHIKESFGSTARKDAGDPTPLLTSWRIYNVISTSSEFTINLDGAELYTTATNTVAFPSQGRIGRYRGGNYGYWNGWIAEIIVFDHKLTSAERASVLAYFQTKYDLSGSAPSKSLFPWRPNWDKAPMAAGAGVEVDRREIGQARELALAYYDAPQRRAMRFSCLLLDAEPWQALTFFQSRLNTDTFWLPAGVSEARLAADVAAVDMTLTTDQAGSGQFIILDDGIQRTPLEVVDASTTTWQLASAVGQAYESQWTRIESLILARLHTARLSLSFLDALVAKAEFTATEAPLETALVDGEDFGVTIGTLPTLAYLYTFTITYPSTAVVWRYTSFERDLSYGGNTFTAVPIEHDNIISTPTLERHEVELKSRHIAAGPLARLIPFTLEWPLMIQIQEVDVSGNDAANPATLFEGEIVSARFDGPFITATGRSLPGLFSRKLPRRLLQPSCNWTLFEARCGLDKTYWKWQGNVGTGGYDPVTLALTLVSVAPVSPNGGHSITDHYLAGGWVELGSGASAQFRLIADNTAMAGTTVALRLATPFVTAPADGALVYFFPGCDNRVATCNDKFSNRPNFGGFAFMPIGNPSMLKIAKNTSAGGKK